MEKDILVEGNVEPIVPKLPNRKYGYFRDDQIMFLVTHSGSEVTIEQREAFRQGINDFLKEQQVFEYPGYIKELPDVITFPELTQEDQEYCRQKKARKSKDVTMTGAFSIMRCLVEDALENPIDQMRLIEFMDKGLESKSFDGLIIEGTSLNWLTSIVSQGSGTGGPGGIPTPYYGSRKNAPYKFSLVESLQGCGLYGDGSDVHVAILDTAPSAHDLVAAHKEWPDHPLIETLLGLDGKLHLYPTNYEETLRLGNASLNGSDYRMTDHGLFIAGIIHSIVPKAEIHLIEVLNQNGVGDFLAFAAGMAKVRDQVFRPGRKTVLNCSFMFDFPGDDHHCHHPKSANVLPDPDLEFERQVRQFVRKNQRRILRFLRVFFNQAYHIGRGAIAAAGNDAYDDDQTQKHVRPLARYPAALELVWGAGSLPPTLDRIKTGALRGHYRPSNFSNRSDRPEADGVATLGGEDGDGEGILGLYIGDFPDGRANVTKWARWYGTSFSAAILTGAFAYVLSSQPGFIRTDEAYRILRKTVIENAQVDKEEDALPVTQC